MTRRATLHVMFARIELTLVARGDSKSMSEPAEHMGVSGN